MNPDGLQEERSNGRLATRLIVALIMVVGLIVAWSVTRSNDDGAELHQDSGVDQQASASAGRRDATRGGTAASWRVVVVDHLTDGAITAATLGSARSSRILGRTDESGSFETSSFGEVHPEALRPSDLRVTMDDERGRRELAVMGIDRPDESTFRVRAAATARITFAIEDARSTERPTMITVVSLPEIPPIDASESPIWKRSHATMEALRKARFRDYRRILASVRLLDEASDLETEFEVPAGIEVHRIDIARPMELGVFAWREEDYYTVSVRASATLGHETRIELSFVPWPVVQGRVIDEQGRPVAKKKVEVTVAIRVNNDDTSTWSKIQPPRRGLVTVARPGAPDAVVSSVHSRESDSDGRFRVPVPFTANVAIETFGDEHGRGIDYRQVAGTFEPVLDVEVLLRRNSVDRIRVVNSAGAPVTEQAFRIETEESFLPKVEIPTILTDEQGYIDTTMLTRGMTYDLCSSPGKSVARFVCRDGEVIVVDH